ncbi:hypothetical protein MAHJHV47_45200 [Mycobacterium avium subsp. hominissuis]
MTGLPPSSAPTASVSESLPATRFRRPAAAQSAGLRNLVAGNDSETLAVGAEDGGNPVIGLVRLLRERADR